MKAIQFAMMMILGLGSVNTQEPRLPKFTVEGRDFLERLGRFGLTPARANTSGYPFFVIEMVKSFTDPLQDDTQCESGGGFIAEVNCHLRSMGVEGVGSYSGDDGFRVDLIEGDTHDYVAHAYRDETKFMEYRFNRGGRVGRMQFLAEIPDGDYAGEVRTALFLSWNSEDEEAQSLQVIINRLRDAEVRSWEGRKWALSLNALVNGVENTAQISAGYNATDEGEFSYKMRVVRNATHSVGYGEECNILGEGCVSGQSPAYHCVENPPPGWDPNEESIEATLVATHPRSLERLTEESGCEFAAGSDLSVAGIGVGEASLGLWSHPDLRFDF